MDEPVRFLYEIGQLKRVGRSGWWLAGIRHPESVAEHSFRTAVIGFVIAHLEDADPYQTAVLCLFHDLPEARVNDTHRVEQTYLSEPKPERRVFRDQIADLPADLEREMMAMFEDYEGGSSVEAQLARDADVLECLLQAREYEYQGHEGVAEWFENHTRNLHSETAVELADRLLKQSPHEWWERIKADPSDRS